MSFIKSSALQGAFLLFLSISVQAQSSKSPKFHIVEPMEYLYSIAMKYNVPMSDLAKWNNMSLDEVIPIGRKLYLEPVSQSKDVAPAEYSTSNKPSSTRIQSPAKYQKQSGGYHVVQALETIEGIARLYNLSPETLRKLNGLRDREVVLVGTKLKTKA